MVTPHVLDFPAQLQAPGTAGAPFEPVLSLTELPMGTMTRVTHGDLDVLVAHTEAGLLAVDDRCPHMSAPLSAGQLEDCTLTCPLHRGAFDVRNGEVVTFPTTGGLTADGEYRRTWTPEGRESKAPLRADDPKAQARALTRVRRLRYYPLRMSGDSVEIRWPR